MKKWSAIIAVAIVIWVAVLAVLYRRQVFSEKDRKSWERYYLSAETRAILNGSEKFVLLSVDPTPETFKADIAAHSNENLGVSPTNGAPAKQAGEVFHDHLVLGRLEIKDANRKRNLLAALYRGIEESRVLPASCFDPRHAIIAINGTNRVELLICFECAQGVEFVDSDKRWFLVGKAPKEIFNRTLNEAGVPLAK